MKSNLLEVTHISDDGRYRNIIMDLDLIKIHSVAEVSESTNASFYWHLPGAENDGEIFMTKTTDTYASLKERIFGVKE